MTFLSPAHQSCSTNSLPLSLRPVHPSVRHPTCFIFYRKTPFPDTTPLPQTHHLPVCPWVARYQLNHVQPDTRPPRHTRKHPCPPPRFAYLATHAHKPTLGTDMPSLACCLSLSLYVTFKPTTAFELEQAGFTRPKIMPVYLPTCFVPQLHAKHEIRKNRTPSAIHISLPLFFTPHSARVSIVRPRQRRTRSSVSSAPVAYIASYRIVPYTGT